MSGKIFVIGLLSFALVFGAALWYYQTNAYYFWVDLQEPEPPQTSAVVPSQPVVTDTLAAPTVSLDLPSSPQPSALQDQKVASLPAVDASPAPEITSHPTGKVRIRMIRYSDGQPETILLKNFRGIDADTSPLKFKACFKMVNSIPFLTETYEVYDDATPLRAPRWFDCFDVDAITDDLDSGLAIAFMSERNIKYGVDRVIAVRDDGQAFVWHQFNECGAAVYSGEAVPDGCPPKPEG